VEICCNVINSDTTEKFSFYPFCEVAINLDRLKMHDLGTNKTQVLIGCVALFGGFLFYLINRPPDTYFVSFIRAPDASSYWDPSFFRAILEALPSFLHVFAFSLIIGGLLPCRKTGYLIICCAWLFTNVLFELGQRHGIAASQIIPPWFEGVFILENMQNYFLKGTFDLFDLLASLVGAAAAYCILTMTIQDRRE